MYLCTLQACPTTQATTHKQKLSLNWYRTLPFNYEREAPDGLGLIKPQTVIEKLSNLTADMKDRTIITTGMFFCVVLLPIKSLMIKIYRESNSLSRLVLNLRVDSKRKR